MNDTELKPCPFCGERAETDFVPEHHSYQVECSDSMGCTARIIRDSELGAIEAWNCRAAIAAAQAQDALTAAYMAGSHDAKKSARAAAQPVAVVASKLGDICSFRSSVARKGDVVYFQPPAQAQEARQPLTDAEVSSVYFEVLGTVRIQDPTLINRLVRAIEAAHGIT